MVTTTHEQAGITPERIYFDMDGVLADFSCGVEELARFVQHSEQGEDEAEEDRMWAAISRVPHFYDRLEPIGGSLELFREVHALYGDRCELLTGVPSARRNVRGAGEDKVSWAGRMLPEGVKVNLVLRKQKRGFANGAGSILIDDYVKNTSEWEGSGGTAILFADADGARAELRRLGIL